MLLSLNIEVEEQDIMFQTPADIARNQGFLEPLKLINEHISNQMKKKAKKKK